MTHPNAVLPQPRPEAPPGLGPLADTVLNWLAWACMVGGIAGVLICALMIILGRRGRNNMAIEGLTSTLYVAGGLSIAASATGLVGVFFFPSN